MYVRITNAMVREHRSTDPIDPLALHVCPDVATLAPPNMWFPVTSFPASAGSQGPGQPGRMEWKFVYMQTATTSYIVNTIDWHWEHPFETLSCSSVTCKKATQYYVYIYTLTFIYARTRGRRGGQILIAHSLLPTGHHA